MTEEGDIGRFKCPHCQQSLEYESDMAGLELACPTCGKTISVPSRPTLQTSPESPPPSPPEQKKGAPRQTDPNAATPKQIAYLTFMGYPKADRLTKAKAGEAIESLSDVSDLSEYERIEKRKSEWIQQRFILHPDLYSYELKNFFIHELPETLHNFVRSRMTGASEKLTKTKIRQVVNALGREHADWWKEPDFKNRFWSKLQEMHPGCCDGQLKEQMKKVPSKQRRGRPAPGAKPSGNGCLVTVILIISAVTAVAAMMK